MRLTNLTVRDLITPDSKLTFLAGAGCSIDPPSCLLAGRAMMDAIIDYTCADLEIEGIKKLKKLRFEALVEIVRDQLDKELKIIDYYGLCDKPNIQHLFLADMIKRGSFVITTNFDFLIEYALQQLGVPDDNIVPVITREDFEEFQDPYKQLKKGKKTVYKIHGSTKNIITKKSTRDSLIATIKAFGSNKEGENVFQLESFKQPAFAKITENRSLVIMGYSGSDDFDIVPTLQVLKNLNNIIWINYVHDDEGKELIYKITTDVIDEPKELDKVDQILVEIKRMNNKVPVYKVNANTHRIVNEILDAKPKLSSEKFSVNALDWLGKNITLPSEMRKYFISYKIYWDLDIYDKAMTCSENNLRIAEELGDLASKATAFNNIGMIYREQGNYPEALKRYEEALQIDEQLGDLSGKATVLNNIASIHYAQGNYPEALKLYEEASQIDEQLGNLISKAGCLNNIASIHYAQGNYPEALKRYEEALQIVEQLGDLASKATAFNNIGMIYGEQGNYPEALKRYEEALQIDGQLGDLSGKATVLNNIASIHYAQGNYPEALKRYEEALQIAEQLGDLASKTTALNNIGMIYDAQGNYPEALKRYEKALQIAEQLGNLSGKATVLSNMASIHYAQGNYSEALKRYGEALQIAEQLGNLSGKAIDLNNIGMIYKAQGNYPEALKRYGEALQIAEQLGNLSGKATVLNNIGTIYKAQGNYPEALKRYEEALQIDEQLGNLSGKAIDLNNIGESYKAQGNYPEALRRYEEALQILNVLGLSESPNAKIIKENIEILKS
jgi:tetratricopeptide (TPR) repeat protein